MTGIVCLLACGVLALFGCAPRVLKALHLNRLGAALWIAAALVAMTLPEFSLGGVVLAPWLLVAAAFAGYLVSFGRPQQWWLSLFAMVVASWVWVAVWAFAPGLMLTLPAEADTLLGAVIGLLAIVAALGSLKEAVSGAILGVVAGEVVYQLWQGDLAPLALNNTLILAALVPIVGIGAAQFIRERLRRRERDLPMTQAVEPI